MSSPMNCELISYECIERMGVACFICVDDSPKICKQKRFTKITKSGKKEPHNILYRKSIEFDLTIVYFTQIISLWAHLT